MYCTGFHSHNASLTGMEVWLLSSLYLLVQAIVHCGSMFTVIWLSHLPALLQCRPVLFLWLVQQRGMNFQCQSKASPNWCPFSISPPSQDCSFPLGLNYDILVEYCQEQVDKDNDPIHKYCLEKLKRPFIHSFCPFL